MMDGVGGLEDDFVGFCEGGVVVVEDEGVEVLVRGVLDGLDGCGWCVCQGYASVVCGCSTVG